ncbi:MAG: hypothetical protein JWN36_2396, partial [Microbacteriaceae bacterium]|nr:hypothetical protein [Microbacteriaceae bacterium]
MTTARAALLPGVDLLRGLLDTTFGLRQFTVVVRVNTWAPGALPGAQGAAKTAVDTPLVVHGGQRPKVVQVSQRDVLASGGQLQDLDLRVGPLTPASAAYPTGVAAAIFDPPLAGSSTEVLFNVAGPGLPVGGAWFKKLDQDLTGNFSW